MAVQKHPQEQQEQLELAQVQDLVAQQVEQEVFQYLEQQQVEQAAEAAQAQLVQQD
jgi:hypothetical protein